MNKTKSGSKKPKQLSLFPMANPHAAFKIENGRRKSARPLSSRQPIHLILKAGHTIRQHESKLVSLWHKLGAKMGLKTYGLVVAHDHVHGVIKIHNRKAYHRFIRALTGLLSLIFKIQWRHRPVTRLATWGQDFKRLRVYLKLNKLEASGGIPYQPKRTRGLSEDIWDMLAAE